MPRLIWAPSALADIQRLYHFLAPKDETAARRAIKAIRSGQKILAHQSEAGRLIEDMDPAFREWPIAFGSTGYIALYHFDGETVAIPRYDIKKKPATNKNYYLDYSTSG